MNPQRAVEVFLQSLAECSRRDPKAPALRADEEIVCQGFARNRTLEQPMVGNSYRDALERIALGVNGRQSSGLRPNEVGALPKMSKPDWQLAQEALELPLDGPSWRYVNRNELPDGAPVEPGTTLYAFRDGDVFHWEYELPALPHATSQPEEKA